jgi:hypothetical protein
MDEFQIDNYIDSWSRPGMTVIMIDIVESKGVYNVVNCIFYDVIESAREWRYFIFITRQILIFVKIFFNYFFINF